MITNVLFFMFTFFSAGLIVVLTNPVQAEGQPVIQSNIPVMSIFHMDDTLCMDSDGD